MRWSPLILCALVLSGCATAKSRSVGIRGEVDGKSVRGEIKYTVNY